MSPKDPHSKKEFNAPDKMEPMRDLPAGGLKEDEDQQVKGGVKMRDILIPKLFDKSTP